MFMYMNSLFFPSLAVCYEQDKSIQRPAFFLSIVSPPKLGGEVPSVFPLLPHAWGRSWLHCSPITIIHPSSGGLVVPSGGGPLDLTVPL